MSEAIPLFLQQISVSSQSLETEPYKVMLFLVSDGPTEGKRNGGQSNGEKSNEGSYPLGSQPWGLFVLSFSQLVFHMHLGRRRINPSVTAIAWCLLLTPVPFCLPSSFSSINYLWFTFWKLAITGESPLLSSARAVGVGVRGSHEKKEKNQGERNVWVIGKQQSWKKGSEFYFWLLL